MTQEVELEYTFVGNDTYKRCMVRDNNKYRIYQIRNILEQELGMFQLRNGVDFEIDVSGSNVSQWCVIFKTDEVYSLAKMALMG